MVRDRAEEVDTVPHGGGRRDCLEPFHLTLVAVFTVLAQDQQANVIVGPIAQECEGPDCHLDPFQPLEPADEKQQPAWPVSDLPPCLFAVDRLEHREVDAGRDHNDAFRIGSVALDQVGGLLAGRRDQEIGLARDLSFHPDSEGRLGVGALRKRSVLDQPQGVRDVRPARRHLRPEETSDLAREPVVGEQHVVRAFPFGEPEDLVRERRHLVVEAVFVEIPSGGEVDHARVRCEEFHRGVRRAPAGEDVGGDAALAEGQTGLANVNVEAAVGVLAQGSCWGGMHGNDRDPPSGAVGGETGCLSHGTPISRQASVSRRSRMRNGRPANRKP